MEDLVRGSLTERRGLLNDKGRVGRTKSGERLGERRSFLTLQDEQGGPSKGRNWVKGQVCCLYRMSRESLVRGNVG